MTEEERLVFISENVGCGKDSLIASNVNSILKKHEELEEIMQRDIKVLLQQRTWLCKLVEIFSKFYLEDRENESFKDIISKFHKIFDDNNIPWEGFSALVIPKIENQNISLENKNVSNNDNIELRSDISNRLQNIIQ